MTGTNMYMLKIDKKYIRDTHGHIRQFSNKEKAKQYKRNHWSDAEIVPYDATKEKWNEKH